MLTGIASLYKVFKTRLGDFQIAECEGKSGYFFKRKGVFWFIKQINNK